MSEKSDQKLLYAAFRRCHSDREFRARFVAECRKQQETSMSKRSEFEHRADDFYPTPRRAADPLIPWLGGIRTFAEPCRGAGDLVRHLEARGLSCVWQSDIKDGRDALTLDSFGAADAIITNPPHTRSVLHPMITHFQRILPTWLLIDSDWAMNAHAAKYLQSCSDIVPIGRVKWITGTDYSGMDNYAWYRFDARHARPGASWPRLRTC
jgi:hypothetical protein